MKDARAAVIAEAMDFRGSRYHHMGRVKGAGVDCLTLIVEAYERAGVIPHYDLPYYSPQFNLHRSTETYLQGLLGFGREIEEPLPADIVIWKFGRVYSHAAIVIEWPRIIHAHLNLGVIEDDANSDWLRLVDEKGAGIIPRPRKFFTHW